MKVTQDKHFYPLYITNAKASIWKAMRTKDRFGILLFYEWFVACWWQIGRFGSSYLNPSHPLEPVLYEDDSINKAHIRSTSLITLRVFLAFSSTTDSSH